MPTTEAGAAAFDQAVAAAEAEQNGRTVDDGFVETLARTEAERDDRELCLHRALRLTIGDERFSDDPCAIIDLAEYIRTGARGVPLPCEPPRGFVAHLHPGRQS
jgi:hypothetical protein